MRHRAKLAFFAKCEYGAACCLTYDLSTAILVSFIFGFSTKIVLAKHETRHAHCSLTVEFCLYSRVAEISRIRISELCSGKIVIFL